MFDHSSHSAAITPRICTSEVWRRLRVPAAFFRKSFRSICFRRRSTTCNESPSFSTSQSFGANVHAPGSRASYIEAWPGQAGDMPGKYNERRRSRPSRCAAAPPAADAEAPASTSQLSCRPQHAGKLSNCFMKLIDPPRAYDSVSFRVHPQHAYALTRRLRCATLDRKRDSGHSSFAGARKLRRLERYCINACMTGVRPLIALLYAWRSNFVILWE